MPNDSLGKRVLITLFLLFFTMSCSENCRQWEYDEINTHCSCYDSSRVYLPLCNRFCELEVEIIVDACATRTYLNALLLDLPFEEDNPSKTSVTINVEEQKFEFLADRFEGGQKILLPSEAQNLIIENLLQNKDMTIVVGRYVTEVTAKNFGKIYQKLNF